MDKQCSARLDVIPNSFLQSLLGNIRLWRFLSRLLICGAFLYPLLAQGQSTAQSDRPRILLLYSYGYGGKGVEIFSEGFRSAMNGAGVSVNDLYFEYLDLERNAGIADYRNHLRSDLLTKYADRNIGLIVTVQQPALRFLLQEGRELAPTAPAITLQAPLPTEEEARGRRIVSQLARFDLKGTLERALELFPNTRRVVIVSGSSAADLKMADEATRAAANWHGRLDFEFTGAFSLEQMLQRVAHLPPDTIILFTQYNRDSSGRTTLAYEVEGMITKLANAPVFGLYDFNLSNGGIGGSVISVRTLGERTARTALKILEGTFPFPQQVMALDNPAVPMFDWNQIERWGGDARRLPEDSVLLNRPRSFWEQYRYYVIVIVAFVLAQFLTIAGLLINKRRRQVAEDSLRESEERFRVLIEHAPDAIVVLDVDLKRFVDANRQAEVIYGCSREVLLSGGPERFYPPDLPGAQSAADKVQETIQQALSGQTIHYERGLINAQGKELVCEIRLVRLTSKNRRLVRGSLVDITERKRNENLIAGLLAEKDAILQNAVVGIVMLKHRKIVTCNKRFEELFGYPSGTMVGLDTRVLYISEEVYDEVGVRAYETIRHESSYSKEVMLHKRDGQPFWGALTGSALDPKHPQEGSIWIYTDITDRKQAEENVHFLAYHDVLTELPNHLLLKDRVIQAIASAERSKLKVALLFLDLDNFKIINDSLGHLVGDTLIKEVAARLIGCVRDTDTISRQGGDEFLILLPALPDAGAIAPILVKLMAQLLEPFEIEGQEIGTSVSVGIAIYPNDGNDFDTLLKKADMAMYRAKDSGRNTYRFFDEQMNVDAVEYLSMRNGLRRALERSEFLLYYQPQIDIPSGAIIGAEALIRWNHPEHGMVPPGRFISVAEESGLIVPIGEWVLREACRQMAAWQRLGISGMVVAVNLSALQFKRGDIEQTVINALEESGIDPGLLELELTESILIHDTETILATVKRLKHLGVKLSIDDFGTGYSSLSYLKRFEVNKLKIDQSFVRDLATNPDDAAIVRAIIQLGRNLNLKTIAEGVEDQNILDQLRIFACDEAQGYFFARPMPAAEFVDYFFRARLES